MPESCPRCHLEDITRADFYGFVVPFVNELQRLSRGSGDPGQDPRLRYHGLRRSLYRARRCRAAWPGIIYGLQHYSDVPSEHAGMARPQRFLQGAWPTPPRRGSTVPARVNCSLLGIGERTGNVPLEAMVFEYASLRGLAGRHGHRRSSPRSPTTSKTRLATISRP